MEEEIGGVDEISLPSLNFITNHLATTNYLL